MTIVEVLVAAIILVIGALATFEIFDAAAHNKVRTEQRQVALDRAQREIEKLRDVPYGNLALTSTPIGSADQADPRWRVHGTDFALNRDGTGDATMVANGGALFAGGLVSGGVVDPGPEHFVSGNISGDIFRFVVWRSDPSCTVCAGSQHLKRVIVIVRPDLPRRRVAPAHTSRRNRTSSTPATARSAICRRRAPGRSRPSRSFSPTHRAPPSARRPASHRRPTTYSTTRSERVRTG